ncbi:hypothetical protein OJJOAM_003661 [Cupriavidus sp. H18C1]
MRPRIDLAAQQPQPLRRIARRGQIDPRRLRLGIDVGFRFGFGVGICPLAAVPAVPAELQQVGEHQPIDGRGGQCGLQRDKAPRTDPGHHHAPVAARLEPRRRRRNVAPRLLAIERRDPHRARGQRTVAQRRHVEPQCRHAGMGELAGQRDEQPAIADMVVAAGVREQHRRAGRIAAIARRAQHAELTAAIEPHRPLHRPPRRAARHRPGRGPRAGRGARPKRPDRAIARSAATPARARCCSRPSASWPGIRRSRAASPAHPGHDSGSPARRPANRRRATHRAAARAARDRWHGVRAAAPPARPRHRMAAGSPAPRSCRRTAARPQYRGSRYCTSCAAARAARADRFGRSPAAPAGSVRRDAALRRRPSPRRPAPQASRPAAGRTAPRARPRCARAALCTARTMLCAQALSRSGPSSVPAESPQPG